MSIAALVHKHELNTISLRLWAMGRGRMVGVGGTSIMSWSIGSMVFEFEGWCSLVHRRIIERHEINDKKSHSMTVLIVECRYDETFELSYHART